MQRKLVVSSRLFDTNYQSQLEASSNPTRLFCLDCLTLEDEADSLTRNVANELPIYAA